MKIGILNAELNCHLPSTEMRQDGLDIQETRVQLPAHEMKRKKKGSKTEEMKTSCYTNDKWLSGDPVNPARQERQNFNFPDLI